MPPFTERELDLMAVLWELGSGTVAQVHERLEDEIAYNTVLTMLRNMERKGYVYHEDEGRAYRYHPKVPRERAGETAVQRLVDKLFRGSPELMVTHLITRSEMSRSDLRRVRELLEDRLASDRGRGV